MPTSSKDKIRSFLICSLKLAQNLALHVDGPIVSPAGV